MKKIGILFLMLFVIISTSYSQAHAETGIFVKKDDIWILAGYNQNVAGEEGVTQSFGPIQGTFGGDIGRLFAMEIQLGGRIGKNIISSNSISSLQEKLSIFDTKLYLMFQPKFALPGIALRPYVGFAPSVHFTQVEIERESPYEALDGIYEKKSDSFDFGFAAKAGLRMQLVKLLMIGINVEYQFNPTKITYKGVPDYDMSGFSVGAEIGVSF